MDVSVMLTQGRIVTDGCECDAETGQESNRCM
jgi:hypothetical protein